MANQFELDVLAEFAALNMAVHRIFTHLAGQSGDARAFLDRELELGLEGLSKTKYWSVPADQSEAFLENARARYTDVIGSIRKA